VRVGFNQSSHDPLKQNHWKELDVNIKRLVPDIGQELNELKLKKQLNPSYQKRPKRHLDNDDEGG
jgi:hypothetical protein